MHASTQVEFRGPGIRRWLSLAIVLAVSVVGGCRPAGLAEPASQSAPTVIRVATQAQDRIDGLDLATAPDGSVHLVWRESPASHGASARLMYRRGHGDPLRWEAPVQLATITGIPRVVAARDGVHVFAGSRLDHWLLPTGADRWQPQAALLGDHQPRAIAFDVVAVRDSLVVAYTSGGASPDQALHTLRWSNGQAGPAIPLVRHRAQVRTRAGGVIRLHDPVLVQRDDRLLLLWGMRVPSLVERGARLESRVYAAWSADGGSGWSRPAVVTGEGADDYVRDLAAGIGGPAPLALFVAHGLFASRWADDTWSPPQRLAAHDIGALSGSAKAFGVAASACAGQSLVAWVDGRHQRSDRRWWNPLGGFPWSDSPDWINNDLFLLAGGELVAALDGRPATPLRQTVPGGYVEDVAVAGRGDHALLVWAGRASVRKSRTDTDAPSTVWQRRIECD